MLLLMVSMVACQRDMQTDISQMQVEQLYPYAISEELALVRLNEFLQAWDGDETRASQRVVKSISSINCDDVIPSTRSTDLNLDIDDLLYVVEFEDGKGSAVIGADTRVESVYAVLDETVLSAADFERAVNSPNADDLSTQIAATILISALTDAAAGTYDFRPDEEILDDFTYQTTSTTIVARIPPLVATKWGQGSPYNNLFPIVPGSNGVHEDAGCGTIACAQILASLMYPSNIVLNGHAHDWSIISEFTHGHSIDNEYYKTCLARFIYDVGLELGLDYNHDDDNDPGTTTTVASAGSLFISLGYSNVQRISLDLSEAYTMLSHNKPFYVKGTDYRDLSDVGSHAWVIDGWKKVRTDIIEIVRNQTGIVSQRIIGSSMAEYVHCNYGWNGKCDGYYSHTIFNVENRLSSSQIEASYGDVLGTNGRIYSSELEMIKYNF